MLLICLFEKKIIICDRSSNCGLNDSQGNTKRGTCQCSVWEPALQKCRFSALLCRKSFLAIIFTVSQGFTRILSWVWMKPLLRASNITKRQLDICLLMGDLITTHEVILPNKLSLNLIKALNPNTNLLKIQWNRVPWKKKKKKHCRNRISKIQTRGNSIVIEQIVSSSSLPIKNKEEKEEVGEEKPIG